MEEGRASRTPILGVSEAEAKIKPFSDGEMTRNSPDLLEPIHNIHTLDNQLEIP